MLVMLNEVKHPYGATIPKRRVREKGFWLTKFRGILHFAALYSE